MQMMEDILNMHCNINALLHALMQHACLIIHQILCCVNSVLKQKFKTEEESTSSVIYRLDKFYRNWPQFGKDIIKKIEGVFFYETPCRLTWPQQENLGTMRLLICGDLEKHLLTYNADINDIPSKAEDYIFRNH